MSSSNLDSKIIVMARLESGEDIKVSVKSLGEPFEEAHKVELCNKVTRELIPHAEEVLYYTARRNVRGKKCNWRFTKVSELKNFLETCLE